MSRRLSKIWELKLAKQRVAWLILFVGAGYSWPYIRFRRYSFTVYIHCGQGVCFGLGWNETDRQISRRISQMTPEEKQRIRDILKRVGA